MGLDSSEDIDSLGLSGSSEAPSEKSEKQREQSKKAQSQLQKTQKDEQKAKDDNDALFQILMRFIKNPYYESLIPTVSSLLERGFPSRYILSLVALVYPDAALFFFQAIGTPEKAMKITSLHRHDTLVEFHENNLDSSIREWMSLWISATEQYLSQKDMSVIIRTKLIHLFQDDISAESAIVSVSQFFQFFFQSRNITLPERESIQYARFVIRTILTTVNLSLESADQDLKKSSTLTPEDLFGI